MIAFGIPVSAGVAAPAISVCLPTYNRAHYLQETIASILRQSVSDFELIIADNCSTDSTPVVVASFPDPRIRYVRHTRNLEHYQNMDAAIGLARGRYVCLVHDDDVYAPDFLARESDVLDRHASVGMVHCAVRLIDSDRHPLGLHRVAKDTRISSGLEEFRRYLGGHDVVCSTVMCRRDIWRQAGPFEHRLKCADWLMWLRIALRTDIGYVATPLADIRVHQLSVTSAMDPMRWYEEFVELTDRAMADMRALNLTIDGSPEALCRFSSSQQSRRFLMAALAAAADGADERANGYLRVLDRLKARGAAPVYAWIGRVLTSRTTRPLIRPIRAVRRSIRRSRAEGSGPF